MHHGRSQLPQTSLRNGGGRRRAGLTAKKSTRRVRRRTLKQPPTSVGRRLRRLWPSAKTRRRVWRLFRRSSRPVKGAICVATVLLIWLITNGIYQVVRKPSELFFPVAGTLNKTPNETWQQYAALFTQYSTNIMTPDLLAAIAQVEGSGNPVARTYWRWAWTTHPLEIYRPASSAVGMYQITDGTFAEARKFCIHNHQVVADGPWNDWRSCWFNSLYARVIPRDAVELTAAHLDRSVTLAMQRHHVVSVSVTQKQTLAALIHLCGAGAGEEYVRRGFRLTDGQRCGDHEAHVYITRVMTMKAIFDQLAARNAT
jgi:hypothetical protein